MFLLCNMDVLLRIVISFETVGLGEAEWPRTISQKERRGTNNLDSEHGRTSESLDRSISSL